jgi:hypothetical protein
MMKRHQSNAADATWNRVAMERNIARLLAYLPAPTVQNLDRQATHYQSRAWPKNCTADYPALDGMYSLTAFSQLRRVKGIVT